MPENIPTFEIIQILLQSNLELATKMAVVTSAVRFSPTFFHHSSTRDETSRIVEVLQKLLMLLPNKNLINRKKTTLTYCLMFIMNLQQLIINVH